MNRKLIAVMLMVLLILLVGCRSKNNVDVTVPADAAGATDQIGTATEENTPTETLHPALVENPFGDEIEETTGTTGQEETTAATEGNTAATEPPKATEAPTEPAVKPTEPDASEDDGEMNYEKYMSLSAAEQSNYMNSFESVDAFFAWYNAAKAEHDAQNNDIEIGNGSFDLGELGG